MKNTKSKFAVIAGITFALVSVLQSADAFKWFEQKSYDSRMRATARFFSPSEEISVVLLKQSSLDWARREKGWGWPWPREAYGDIVNFFNRANAASVAFDMLFTEPSVYGKSDDDAFAKACKDFNRVIQIVHYENGEFSEEPIMPVSEIAESAAVIADVTTLFDDDKTVRRGRLFAPQVSGEPSLVSGSLIAGGKNNVFSTIPIAKNGGMHIRFLEDIDRYAPYTAEQILKNEYAIRNGTALSENEMLLPEQFENAHVFFGVFAPGLFDMCSTPVDAVYPGVGVHVSQLDTILQENYLYETPVFATFSLILLCAVLGAFLGLVQRKERTNAFILNLFLFVCALLAYIFAAYAAFAKGRILPFSPPVLSLALSFSLCVIVGYFTEGKQKRYLKAAFRQYLSPAVIEELIENPSMLKLGGEEKEITAFFSDIKSFSSISEKLSPEEIKELLNAYLSAMTDIILAHGGTIDKYEGDAIVAFWGAPVTQKDHAKRAVEAAVECQQKLVQMRPQFEKYCEGIFHRIGLNTGRAVVGNFGSKQRFDYTMLGDAVNLAARLEGVNKQFGTSIMCSKATVESAVENGCKVEFRKIADIAVVGRKEVATVFEPLSGNAGKIGGSMKEFSAALQFFSEGKFAQALELFKKNADFDVVSEKYAEKCARFIENQPENWCGFLQMTEK